MIAAAIGCASTLSACALSEDKISLTHNAPAGVAHVPGAEAAPLRIVVTDARTLDRTKVGAKINSYGAEMAAIRPDRDVTEVVKEAVERELSARGFPTSGAAERSRSRSTPSTAVSRLACGPAGPAPMWS